MWIFRNNQKLIESNFFDGFTDYHSHILFGVDDGVKELSKSVDVLAYYETLGVKRVVLTPHINVMYNDWSLIQKNFDTLSATYSGGIIISLAAEYMLDSKFYAQAELGLKCLEEDKVLVETSYLNKTANFDDMLYQIANDGHTPVIAHPERYLYMDYSKYHKLKNCDYFFQLNLLSLSGHYGKEVKKRAIYLLEKGMYDMVGSDLHNLDIFRNSVDKIKLSKLQQRKLIEIIK